MKIQLPKESNGVIPAIGLLQVLLIILKFTGYIDWSWIWVLSPIWLTGLLFLVIVIGLTILVNRLGE